MRELNEFNKVSITSLRLDKRIKLLKVIIFRLLWVVFLMSQLWILKRKVYLQKYEYTLQGF